MYLNVGYDNNIDYILSNLTIVLIFDFMQHEISADFKITFNFCFLKTVFHVELAD